MLAQAPQKTRAKQKSRGEDYGAKGLSNLGYLYRTGRAGPSPVVGGRVGQVVRRLVVALGPDAEPPPDQLPQLLLVVAVQLPRREQALGVGHDLARLRAAVGLVGGDEAAAVMPGGVRKRLSPR